SRGRSQDRRVGHWLPPHKRDRVTSMSGKKKTDAQAPAEAESLDTQAMLSDEQVKADQLANVAAPTAPKTQAMKAEKAAPVKARVWALGSFLFDGKLYAPGEDIELPLDLAEAHKDFLVF